MKIFRPMSFLLLFGLMSTSIKLLSQQKQARPNYLSQPDREAQLPSPNNLYPFAYWDKGYLITYAADDMGPSKPAVILYDRDGHVAVQAIISFKNAESTTVSDAAVTKSGTLVVSGGTMNSAGVIANFIAEVDSTGHVGRVVRTTPFLPVYICGAEDGTVWSYGFDRDENGEGVEGSLNLRQYSFEKGQIRATLNKFKLYSAWSLTRGRYAGELNLRCTSQKVGIFNGAASEWIEFDIPTNTLKVAKVNPLPSIKEVRILGFAMTESGDVFVSLHQRTSNPPQSGLFKLTFDSSGVGSWTPVANTIGPYLNGGPIERLLGTDGTNLIYTSDLNRSTHWSKIR
jgi:hypothetical protein